MIEPPDKLTHDAISAWVEDIHDYATGEFSWREPYLQVDVIPLACLWALANRNLVGRAHSSFQFARDFMSHEDARELWRKRADKAGDMSVSMDEPQSFQRHIEGLELAGEYSPYVYELYALRDGRPEGQVEIDGVEISLISALGHAAYNSTDGRSVIVLKPELGPPEDDPWGFISLAGDNVREFIDRKL